MYCTKCGTELKDDSKFCHNCGATVKPKAQEDTLGPEIFAPTPPPAQTTQTQQPVQQPAQQTTTNQNEGIFGLLGFILSFFVPIAGLILSIIGMKKTKNRGFAIAGLVISIVSMVIYFIVMVAIIAAGSAVSNYNDPYYYYLASLI